MTGSVGGPAPAAGKAGVGPACQGEPLEIGARRAAFEPAQRIQRWGFVDPAQETTEFLTVGAKTALGIVAVLPGQQRDGVAHLAVDEPPRQIEGERRVLVLLVLRHAQQDVFCLRWRQLPFEPSVEAQKGQLDAVIQQRGQRRGGHVDVAKREDRVHLEALDLQEFPLIFLDDEPLAGFTQGRALFGEIKGCHQDASRVSVSGVSFTQPMGHCAAPPSQARRRVLGNGASGRRPRRCCCRNF